MSERERLLPTVDPAAPRAGSSGDPAGTSVPIASSDNLASLDARRRATTRKFVAQTVSLLGACAVILSCHTQLASVQFGSRDLPSAESAAGTIYRSSRAFIKWALPDRLVQKVLSKELIALICTH